MTCPAVGHGGGMWQPASRFACVIGKFMVRPANIH